MSDPTQERYNGEEENEFFTLKSKVNAAVSLRYFVLL